MKKVFYISALFILAVVFLLSCDDNKDENSDEFLLTVASVKVFNSIEEILPDILDASEIDSKSTSMVDMSPHYYVQYIYHVKPEGQGEWEMFPYLIVGFDYEEGYEYILRVRKEPNELLVPKVTLLEEVSKVKKDSEDISRPWWFTIASKKTGDEDYPYYIEIANNTSTSWTKFPIIEGLQYEEGYEYYIKADCVYNGADAPQKYSFIYKETIKKEKKDSTGLPE